MKLDVAGYSIEKPLYPWLLLVLCLFGGIWGFLSVGKLEDPSFSIPTAIINTEYPGASAREVEEEVTERLERAIQELSQIDTIRSVSMPGRSEIEVEIDSSFHSSQFPQIWDELRRKVNDAQRELPQGTNPSVVNDDFGEVYGLFYAVTSPGYSAHDISQLSRFLQRELLTVENVARVSTAGEREEVIYIDIPQERLNRLGIPLEQLINTIQTENAVAFAGSIRTGDRQVRIITSHDSDSIDQISAIRIGRPGSIEQIMLGDIAQVTRAVNDQPRQLVRFNGEDAFTLAVAGVETANIIEVGDAVEAHLDALAERLPLGVNIEPIYQQHRVVDEAINEFFINLVMSVAIVIGVLWLFMGWRIAMTVGPTLLLTVLGTLFFMGVFSIEMQRVSLGALLIAMGMLVDNAIVVAEGMVINLRKGMGTRKAASQAAGRTQWPLLGATVIGIMAFSSIAFSDDVTGEFLISLFLVILISLTLSWILAVTITPLFGHYLYRKQYPEPDENQSSEASDDNSEHDEYDKPIYRIYRKVLVKALHLRKISVAGLVVLTLVCMWAFTLIPQSFFPHSNTPIFFINYELPHGSDIRATERDMQRMEQLLLADDKVEQVATFIGQGATRFMLTYAPEQPNPGYAQLIVRVHELDDIPGLVSHYREKLNQEFTHADIRIQRLSFGPGDGAELEARFSGNDVAILRELAAEAQAIFEAEPLAMHERHNWGDPAIGVVPVYNELRARQLGIQRDELAQTLLFSSTGVTIGTYREGYDLLPIVARPPAPERDDISVLIDRQIWSQSQQAFVPLAQVVNGFEVTSEEARIHRRNRVRTIAVYADSTPDVTSAAAQEAVQSAVEGFELPPGYRLEWGGEYENSAEAQQGLTGQLPVSLLIMLAITIFLFGRLKQPAIIWAVVPMSICGVVLGLLLTGLPFSFTAMLGMLSLSGMLMKNAIVLVDEIDFQISEGHDPQVALVDASVSRLRPVLLAAGTTSLGMLPLLWDPFFASMAVTIIGGLSFASLLTLVAVPALYSLFFKIKLDRSDSEQSVA
ncbi:efflux RND transporter permease subunit [Aliidiomarina maris]|uniref:Multidrug efflux pump subunit AcrB n=1 Tax=Aliidiomarina maris TaxID=531312 RepID=A0A327X458_9GAMM|nr:efflux RND transporter permease subunit [Aliidiomarina maris]RAK01429.1 multidrug efflux pump subunit AcrB [Aliidiomarina maris]